MSMVAKMILGFSMLCLLTAQAGNDTADEHKYEFYDRCLVIITNKSPENVASSLNTPEQSRISTTNYYRSNYTGEWSLVAIFENNGENNTRVTLLNIRTMKTLVLGIGESTGDVTVVDANYDQERVTLRIGTNNVSLCFGGIGQ